MGAAIDTENPYKGFWDPMKSYREGDQVTYYSVPDSNEANYASTDFYRCLSGTSPVRVNVYNDCPLQNFKFPIVNSKGQVVAQVDPGRGDNPRVLVVDDFYDGETVRTSWQSFKYYSAGTWEGPNGAEPLIINGAKWVKVEPLTSQAGDVTQQKFGSTELTTAGVGLYSGAPGLSTITFDEIADSPDGGELDSDSYYISSVQNYRGYWSAAENYKRFEVVRHDKTNSFYYAKTDIASTETAYSEVFASVVILPPEQPMAVNHVGSIQLPAGQSAHQFKRGQVVGLSLARFSGKQYRVGGASSTLIILCSTDSSSSDDAFYYEEVGLTITAVYGDALTLDSSDEWSSDSFFFDPDYGSSVKFRANNSVYDYGDGYKTIRPKGANSLSMEFDLKFSNRSSTEATAILHFLENKLGQHEVDKRSNYLEYDLGLEGFKMDDAGLFFPYRNSENLTKNFYSFNFSHDTQAEDVHSVSATIFNNDTSILNVNSGLYLNNPPDYSSTKNYAKHDVAYDTTKKSFYYYYADQNSQGDPPVHSDTSVNKDKWTREFYWKPSLPFGISHSPSIEEISSRDSAYSQYNPDNKNNINLLNFNITFDNRSDEEAFAILHFLESRLGYKSFLFIPPAPYNRKRRFVCQEWEHTYNFANNHTISAKFEQYSLGQNTPLDDDEMDSLVHEVEKSAARLVSVGEIVLSSSSSPGENESFFLKNQIEIKNVGETLATNISHSLPLAAASAGVFYASGIGSYDIVTGDGESRISNGTRHDNDEGGAFMYKDSFGGVRVQDNLGRIGAVVDTTSGGEITASSFSRDSEGSEHKSKDFLTAVTDLAPGESAYLEVYFKQDPGTARQRYADELTVNYKSDGSDQSYSTDLVANVNQSAEDLAVTIKIDSPATLDNPYSKQYSFEDSSEICFVKEGDSLANARYTAVFNSGILAEPRNAAEVNALIDECHIEGYIAIGVKSVLESGATQWKYLSDEAVVAADVTNIVAVEGHFLVLDIENGTLKSLPVSSLIDGVAVEYREFDLEFSNINLKNELVSQFSKGNLAQVKQVDFEITGVIGSSSSLLPALRSGAGYPPGCVVNLKVGVGGNPAYIVGRGGKGGDGLVTEGLASQGDNGLISKDSADFATSGDDGGGALLVDELNSKVTFNITLSPGSKIYGGGGGGAGGEKTQSSILANKSGKINFGGGGGGGAPLGVGGQGMGDQGAFSLGGSGGSAVNNSINDQYWVRDGSDGGGFGAAGLKYSGGIVSGGNPGSAIKYYVQNCLDLTVLNANENIIGVIEGPASE